MISIVTHLVMRLFQTIFTLVVAGVISGGTLYYMQEKAGKSLRKGLVSIGAFNRQLVGGETPIVESRKKNGKIPKVRQ